MAAKKSTKKSTKKEETKSTKSKMTKLTFNPIMSAASRFTILLREKALKRVNGNEVPYYVPSVPGLPMKLVVEKGQVIEVNEEQLAALEPWVETEEEYKRRQNFIHDMDAQHPETLTWDMIVAEGGNWSTLADSQHIVYNDKLLRV